MSLHNGGETKLLKARHISHNKLYAKHTYLTHFSTHAILVKAKPAIAKTLTDYNSPHLLSKPLFMNAYVISF